ncbi:MAG: DUF4974 domain-containing protein [Odoribacteraceae bacterium]|jgi:ferric-dicitrate binding protein FerR (iron transport regulator)|nr:DUF4974 domain-containing protein [Odoribacteraceae bacterium]
MTEKYLQQQVYKFLSGEEGFDAREFAREVNDHPALRRVLSGLSGLSGEDVGLDGERVVERVMQLLRARRRRRLTRWRVAAAVALLLTGAGGWWLARGPVAVVASRQEALAPADSARVRLVLAGGEVISIHRLEMDTTIRERGADITWERSGVLAYARSGEGAGEVTYNMLVVPRGNEFRLLLADQTEVRLNSETEVRYPVNFSEGERVVHVKGEAFFKVARDTARPFVVMAGEMRVEALGTEFNVNTYRDQDALTTTLVSGLVRVTDEASGRNTVLHPGQQARLRAGELTVREVNTMETIAWINGQFLYYDMPLEQIARQLERWYNVSIYFQEEALRAYTFTGVIKRYHSLREICSYIEETTNVHFLINEQDVTVRRAR